MDSRKFENNYLSEDSAHNIFKKMATTFSEAIKINGTSMQGNQEQLDIFISKQGNLEAFFDGLKKLYLARQQAKNPPKEKELSLVFEEIKNKIYIECYLLCNEFLKRNSNVLSENRKEFLSQFLDNIKVIMFYFKEKCEEIFHKKLFEKQFNHFQSEIGQLNELQNKLLYAADFSKIYVICVPEKEHAAFKKDCQSFTFDSRFQTAKKSGKFGLNAIGGVGIGMLLPLTVVFDAAAVLGGSDLRYSFTGATAKLAGNFLQRAGKVNFKGIKTAHRIPPAWINETEEAKINGVRYYAVDGRNPNEVLTKGISFDVSSKGKIILFDSKEKCEEFALQRADGKTFDILGGWRIHHKWTDEERQSFKNKMEKVRSQDISLYTPLHAPQREDTKGEEMIDLKMFPRNGRAPFFDNEGSEARLTDEVDDSEKKQKHKP